MRGKNNDAKLMDNIIDLSALGVTDARIAEILETSASNIARVKRAYSLAQSGDTEALRAITMHSATIGEWVASKFNIKPEPAAPKKPEQPDNTATAFAAMLEALKKLTEAVDAIDKRLSAMQLTQQGLRGELGQSMKQVVEAFHVEGDILTKEHQRQTELLASIKSNTKRRGE